MCLDNGVHYIWPWFRLMIASIAILGMTAVVIRMIEELLLVIFDIRDFLKGIHDKVKSSDETLDLPFQKNDQ